MTERDCKGCGERKEVRRGIWAWTVKIGFRDRCLACYTLRNRLWRKANPEKALAFSRRARALHRDEINARRRARERTRYHQDPEYWRADRRERYRRNPGTFLSNELKRRYGITLDDFRALADKQNGLCAICGNPPRDKKRLCVDHCHATGKVRGLLCHFCNRALGFLGDDPARLEKALAYLRGA